MEKFLSLKIYTSKLLGEVLGGLGIQWGSKNLLKLDYADGLCIRGESLSKMNELLEFIDFKTKSLIVEVSEDEKVTFGTENLNSFILQN